MRLRIGVLAVYVLVSIANPHGLSAQVAAPTELTCLEEAAQKIDTGSKITLLGRGGEKTKGYLTSIDLGQSLLTMGSTNRLDTSLQRFLLPDIAKIEYRKPGKLKPGFMALGLLGGALIGGLIGLAIEGESETEQFPFFGGPVVEKGVAFLAGAAIGGGVGLLAGTFIPLVPKTHSIECK